MFRGEQPAARVQVYRRALRSLQLRPAALTCCLKSRLNPWVSLGRMENKGSCPGTCKVRTVIITKCYGAKLRRRLSGRTRSRTEVHGAHRSGTKTFERADITLLQIKQPNFRWLSHSVITFVAGYLLITIFTRFGDEFLTDLRYYIQCCIWSPNWKFTIS